MVFGAGAAVGTAISESDVVASTGKNGDGG